jgi:ribosomal protein S18 acetylase RimI-like enzyme
MTSSDGPVAWRGTPSDAATIAALLIDFNTEFGEPAPSPADLAVRVGELIAAGDSVILLGRVGPNAVSGTSRICGVAVLRFRLAIWSPGLECYLAELYVAPDQRGYGLGRALMIAAMELARSEGADRMDLGTGEDDTVARALYESLGFSNREGGTGSINYFYEIEL